MITRRIQRDGALYFGPFLPASLARRTIDLINRTFQLRTCDIEIDGKLPRPCLEYHIKRCLGPCVKGLCTPDGVSPRPCATCGCCSKARTRSWPTSTSARMGQASDEMRFEMAAKYRDLRKTVLAVSEQQKMATSRRPRRGHLRLLPRGPAPRAPALHDARGQDRRPPRVLLGRLAADDDVRPGLVSGRGADAVLLDRLRAARDSRPGGFRRPRAVGKGSDASGAAGACASSTRSAARSAT